MLEKAQQKNRKLFNFVKGNVIVFLMFLTWDPAQFSFRFVNNIPAGKAVVVAVRPSPFFFV